MRPRETAARGLRVPVVMEASPYYSCCGRGNESELKEYDADGTIPKEPLFYDNYFVPRGYAFVAADLPGTNRSTGCEDVGGREEVLGAKAVIDWLNGRGRATYADGTPAVATRWTNGKVGMSGKSWDGSVANGVAATGVEGLETIVPIAGISSWYDYQRYNGTLRSRGRLAAAGVIRKIWRTQQGHVDPFDIRRAAWVDTLHRWFDFTLQGLHNGIDREPQATIETSPGTWVNQRTWPAATAHPVRVRLGNGDGTTGTLGGSSAGGTRAWTDDPDLTEAAATANPNTPVAGRVTFLSAPLTRDVRLSGIPAATLRVRVDQPTTELTARLVDYGTAARVNYLGPGAGITTLNTESCWGASTAADDACYLDAAEDVVTGDHAVLTRGWQDHRTGTGRPAGPAPVHPAAAVS